MASHFLAGRIAEGEPIAELDRTQVSEAPASLQRQGVARYACDIDGDIAELEMAGDLLVGEGFLPPPDGPARAANTDAQALQSPGPESAYCGPESGGCYRSSNQAWACLKARPSCLAGYCSQSACNCVDDTKWYDLYHAYICSASASCN